MYLPSSAVFLGNLLRRVIFTSVKPALCKISQSSLYRTSSSSSSYEPTNPTDIGKRLSIWMTRVICLHSLSDDSTICIQFPCFPAGRYGRHNAGATVVYMSGSRFRGRGILRTPKRDGERCCESEVKHSGTPEHDAASLANRGEKNQEETDTSVIESNGLERA